ncbi:MAG: hypothetical protein HC821_01715, partial [Lewinella sp.]|nr:hypothetical protein [Lewinella sp.]
MACTVGPLLRAGRQAGFSIFSGRWLPLVVAHAGGGFLLGVAFVIKPVAAAEAMSVGLFTLWLGQQQQQFWRAVLRACLPLSLGFMIPLALVYTYYAQMELLDQLYFYNWALTKAYPTYMPWYLKIKFLSEYALRFFPAVLLLAFALGERKTDDRQWQQFLLLMLLVVDCRVMAWKWFRHYQIQFHPALAALAASWWLPGRRNQPWLRSWPAGRAWAVLAALALSLSVLQYVDQAQRRDEAAAVAAWLKPRLKADDEIFLFNNNQIVYHLLAKPVPTRYVHASLLTYDHHLRSFQIDLAAEGRQLLANRKLRYLVVRTAEMNDDNILMETLLTTFQPLVE